jgi:dihydrofolate reductase
VALNLILARSRDGFIGVNGQLPWTLRDDMDIFRTRTIGDGVVVGRKTYESMLTKRAPRPNPLPGRVLIVVSNSMPESNDRETSFIVTPHLTGVLNMAVSPLALGTFYVAGGEELYKTALPLATRLLVTEVDVDLRDVEGAKARAPDIPEDDFNEIYRREYSTLSGRNEHPFTWRVLDRKPETYA